MRYLVYIIIAIFLVALESSVFSVLNTGYFYPNLLLLAVLAVSLAFDNYDYVFLGLIGGVWMDIFYGLPIGSLTLPLLLSGLLVTGVIRRWLFSDINWQHFILIVIFATLLLYVWLGVYTNLLAMGDWSPIRVSWSQLVRKFLFTTFANLLFAYPIFIIVELSAQLTQRFGRNIIKLK